MKKYLIILFLILSLTAYSQTNKEKAYEIGLNAINEMESGNIEKAIKLLEESIILDPDNIDYPYEIAYAHYINSDYKAAIKILSGLTEHEKVTERIWQMLGNSYDMDKNPEKAIETYDSALIIFPNSGILYLERGNMELFKDEINKALGYYEKGIEVQPNFPSNYYWAAKIFMNSEDEVWGLLYGEIFMNLERNSERTAEISKLLYDTYKSEIKITSDTTKIVSFCKNMIVFSDKLNENGELNIPFGMIYEPILSLSIAFIESVNIKSLNQIREEFIINYYKMGHNTTHPNVLFDYQKKMIEEGHFEAYNNWIFMQGEENTFPEWKENNNEKWDSFIDWFLKNPIEITNNEFHRLQY